MQTLSVLPAEPVQKETVFHEACGFHLLVTLKGCDKEILNDVQKLEELIKVAASATGAMVLKTATHHFTPQGVTAVAVLAESHASLHTFPEHGIAFWDCFTCGTECKPELSVPVLAEGLKAESVNKEIIYRHTRAEVPV